RPPTPPCLKEDGSHNGWERVQTAAYEKATRRTVCGSRRRVDLMAVLRALAGARAAVQTAARAARVQATEVAMMMSLAATAPLRPVDGGFEPAFSLSAQTNARTAPTARPVLLVHGLGGTKSSWSVLAQTLSTRGLTVDAISYAPLGPSVAQLADRLVAKVQT